MSENTNHVLISDHLSIFKMYKEILRKLSGYFKEILKDKVVRLALIYIHFTV